MAWLGLTYLLPFICFNISIVVSFYISIFEYVIFYLWFEIQSLLKKHFLARVALGLTYNYEGDQYTWEEVTITIGLIDVMIILKS